MGRMFCYKRHMGSYSTLYNVIPARAHNQITGSRRKPFRMCTTFAIFADKDWHHRRATVRGQS